MKRFISAVISLLTIAVILPVISCTAYAGTNYAQGWDGDYAGSHFFDGADLFSDDEENELTKLIQGASKDLEMNIVVFAAGPGYAMSDYSTEKFADESYESLFGKDTDGLFFFMDFTEEQPAYDYISTSGKAVLLYQEHISSMFDDMYQVLPPSSASDYSLYKDDIADGIEMFVSLLKKYSDSSGKFSSYYDESTGKYFYYKNGDLMISTDPPFTKRLMPLIFAIPVGIIAAIIFFFTTKSTYKFKASTNPTVYISHENSKFLRREDRFIRTYTTKTKIESSSSGGGGGHSGGGGGGGGGHGGGGAHR